MSYIWYACYGSNLKAARFKCYIAGGKCEENGKEYPGCQNKESWIDSKIKRFPGKLFFANKSSTWGRKGVAFYDPDGDGETIMRLYKITEDQLYDVQQQEGPSPRWYGRKYYLGTEDGIPVYTLTNEEKILPNEPADNYLALIKNALIEECGLSNQEAEIYLKMNCLFQS